LRSKLTCCLATAKLTCNLFKSSWIVLLRSITTSLCCGLVICEAAHFWNRSIESTSYQTTTSRQLQKRQYQTSSNKRLSILKLSHEFFIKLNPPSHFFPTSKSLSTFSKLNIPSPKIPSNIKHNNKKQIFSTFLQITLSIPWEFARRKSNLNNSMSYKIKNKLNPTQFLKIKFLISPHVSTVKFSLWQKKLNKSAYL
jgi:hypothetical protein